MDGDPRTRRMIQPGSGVGVVGIVGDRNTVSVEDDQFDLPGIGDTRYL
ncbi:MULTISPECIES: hypothetical protein [unclassified Gordonia (in: high G+C Gram-positive bacteria)]